MSTSKGSMAGGSHLAPHRILPVLTSLLLVGLLPGCGNLTAGGMGEVVVEVVSDGPASAASFLGFAAAEAGATGPAGAVGLGHGENAAGGAFQGEVTVEVAVALRSESGAWFEVTDGVQRVDVAASGSAAAEIGRTQLPEGRYDRVRVTFHRAEVVVTSAPPGQGFPEGPVVVDFGDEPVLALERPLGGLLGEAGQRIRVNLRASSWVRSAVQGRVPASSFREAVQVTASPGGV